MFAEERERTVIGMPNSFCIKGIGRFFENVDEGVEGRGVHGNLLVRWGELPENTIRLPILRKKPPHRMTF